MVPRRLFFAPHFLHSNIFGGKQSVIFDFESLVRFWIKMNTSGSNKSFGSTPGRLPQTPIIADRYNVIEPPLSTRLERYQLTPRLRIKKAPKINKSNDRRRCDGGRCFMNSRFPQIVSSSPVPPTLSTSYNRSSEESYIDQVFVTEQKIGEGSFGTVFRMRDKNTGKSYAVKCSQEPYRNTRNRQEQQHEVLMHERIPKHENLIEFISAWEERDLLYIQTELCEMSLEEHLHRFAQLPEWRIWDVLLDLVKAVNHLDTFNIIHADIKPANVLISFDGVCKLGDFGLMVDLESDDIDKECYEGDSIYLAREVLNSRITKEATIFSLGLSIFQIATDVYLPSSGQRWHEIRDLEIDPKFTEHLTPELVNLIYRMMATEPSDRPPISTILNSSMLREHNSGYRQWNRTFYPIFRTLSSFHFPKFGGE